MKACAEAEPVPTLVEFEDGPDGQGRQGQALLLDETQRELLLDAANNADGKLIISRRFGKPWSSDLLAAEGFLLSGHLIWRDLNVDAADRRVDTIYQLTAEGRKAAKQAKDRSAFRRCKRGHLQTDDNVYLSLRRDEARVIRGCLICRKMTRAAFNEKRRASKEQTP